MIIEFVGPPGAGKSELVSIARIILAELGLNAMSSDRTARLLCLKRAPLGKLIVLIAPQRWQERILSAVSRRLLMLHRLYFAFQNRSLVLHAVRLLFGTNLSSKDRRTILGYFLRDCSFYQFFRDRLRPDEVLVLGEGLVHRITSLYTSAQEEPHPHEILKYIGLLPQPDFLIWVNTEIGTCVNRVISRGEYRRYLDEELTPYVRNSARTLEIAMRDIEERGWPRGEVNNNGKLDESAAVLRNILTKRFSRIEEKKRSMDFAV
jgi:hypothetical protein